MSLSPRSPDSHTSFPKPSRFIQFMLIRRSFYVVKQNLCASTPINTTVDSRNNAIRIITELAPLITSPVHNVDKC